MELRYCEKCGDIIPLEGRDEKIKPAEHFVCSRCLGGDAAEGANIQAKETSDNFFDSILDESSMNLFSPETVLLKRNEAKAKEEAMQEGQPKPEEEGVPGGAASEKRAGSEVPARTARKLQFHCLHCRAVLLVRPVQRASRMICPKCKGNLFLDQTGIISKSPPSILKMAKPAARAASPPLAGSGAPEEMAMNPSQNPSVGSRPSEKTPAKAPDKAPDKAPGTEPSPPHSPQGGTPPSPPHSPQGGALSAHPQSRGGTLSAHPQSPRGGAVPSHPLSPRAGTVPDKAPGKEGHGADLAENVAKNKIEEARRAFAPPQPIEAKKDLGISPKPPQSEGAARPVPPPALEPSLRSASAVHPAGKVPLPPQTRGGTVSPSPGPSPRGGTEKPLIAIGLKKSLAPVIEPTPKAASPMPPLEAGRLEAGSVPKPTPSSTSVDPHKPQAKEASPEGEKKWERQAPIGLGGKGPGSPAASDAWTEWNKKAKAPPPKDLPDQAASSAADLDDEEEEDSEGPLAENLREADHFTGTRKASVKSPPRYVEALTLPLWALRRSSTVGVFLRLVLLAAALSAPIWTVGWLLPAETTRATAFFKLPSRKKVGEIAIRGVQAILELPGRLFTEQSPRKD